MSPFAFPWSNLLRQGVRVGLGLGAALAGWAATAASDPVGFLAQNTPAQSDRHQSLVFHRPTAFEGTVQAVDGATITVAPGSDTTWSWTSNQWVQSLPDRPDSHFLLVVSGPAEGAWFTITANASRAVTLDLRGESASGLRVGDVIRIVPHWTLATIFPATDSIPGTASIGGVDAPLLVMRWDLVAGINQAASTGYYFYTGSAFGGRGWRGLSQPLSRKLDHDPLPPDVVLIQRNRQAAPQRFWSEGALPLTALRLKAGPLQANVAQDTPLALRVGSSLSLRMLGLVENGLVAPVTQLGGVGADLVMVFDAAASGYNPAAASAYYYYSGTLFGGPGWRALNGSLSKKWDDDRVFAPGQIVVLRQRARSVAGTVTWTVLPPYLE